jgi:hypothetical protein
LCYYLIKGLSTLQNGKIPKFEEEMLLEIFENSNPTSPALQCLQRGLRATGIQQVSSMQLLENKSWWLIWKQHLCFKFISQSYDIFV